MSVRGYELGTSLIERIRTGWMGWQGIKGGSILQNEDRDYFKS